MAEVGRATGAGDASAAVGRAVGGGAWVGGAGVEVASFLTSAPALAVVGVNVIEGRIVGVGAMYGVVDG